MSNTVNLNFLVSSIPTSPRGFKDAIGSGYIEAYFEGRWEKSIGLSVILEHSEIF